MGRDWRIREDRGQVGRVVAATFAPSIGGEPTWLNFGAPHPNQDFDVVIWGRNRRGLPCPAGGDVPGQGRVRGGTDHDKGVEDFLDRLLEGWKSQEPLADGELIEDLTKRLHKRALQGELTAHMGYEKHTPKGRNHGNSLERHE